MVYNLFVDSYCHKRLWQSGTELSHNFKAKLGGSENNMKKNKTSFEVKSNLLVVVVLISV